MKLIDDAQKVLRKAWSVRLMLLAGVLSGFEAITAFIQPDEPPAWWALLVFAVTMGALIARFVAQRNMRDE